MKTRCGYDVNTVYELLFKKKVAETFGGYFQIVISPGGIRTSPSVISESCSPRCPLQVSLEALGLVLTPLGDIAV